MSDSWIILRCADRITLRLSVSLAEDGYDVWVPTVTQTITKEGRNFKKQVTRALAPGLVFARFEYLFPLLELAAMPERPRRGKLPAHQPFSLMRCADKLAVVADPDLEPLRRSQRRLDKPKWAQRAFRKGDAVRATNGCGLKHIEGLIGFVQRSNEKVTVVCFGGLFGRTEIPTSLLSEDEAYRLQSATDTAARKAA
jgi:hypothetical protein